ncbi:MAG TPA: FtsK/SpoIIIE domain-containing protein [Mycobacteriales bacterium]|nr:FtsK/SpoIIIE domain-containing protein [Mycobacteriales bacterium]
MRLTITLRSAEASRHLAVDTQPGTTLADLLEAAGASGAVAVNGRAAQPKTLLSHIPVRDGTVLDVGRRRPATRRADPGALALLVAGGPAAGHSLPLAEGTHPLGRTEPLPLDDPDVSRRHAQLVVTPDHSLALTDLGSLNGTRVQEQPVAGTHLLRPGDLIRMGQSALIVAMAPTADAAMTEGDGGRLRYSRPPRIRVGAAGTKVDLPAPPGETDRAPIPVLAILAPVAIGVMMALLLHQITYLAFTALSPVMAIGNVVSDRRRGRVGHRQRMVEFEARRSAALATARTAQETELGRLRYDHPDPATALLIATGPSSRLWERQRHDDDFLTLRIGTAEIPASVEVRQTAPPTETVSRVTRLPEAPVVVPVTSCGAVGLTGPATLVRALARAMLLTAAVLHSPRELTITLLTLDEARADWEWLRWLPHTRFPDSAAAGSRIGNDEVTVTNRVSELAALIDARRAAVPPGQKPTLPATADLVVVDNSYRVRLETALGPLLHAGPGVGVYFLCLDDTAARLPEECASVVEIRDAPDGPLAQLRRSGHQPVEQIVPDRVTPDVCEELARSIAPVIDAGGVETQAALPGSVRFLELAGLEPPTSEAILAGWSGGGRTTRALLGVGADGPAILDLAQGPHVLIGGTTGSGKSELLQTLVASLAVANRPDAMNFVLVDYKGGAAFRGCAQLPHTVGMLTDLDAFLVERALTSLRAELQRRKALLDAADKTNVSRYWEALPSMPGADPMPRLVVVVDEFAVMAEQLPELLKSLVEIAAQGRSLGVHLVLATQRPAGVVNAEMRANINLRIALRVASIDDSMDVIGGPEAARIPAEGTAGRCLVRTGTSRPVPLQAARVGGLRPGAHAVSASVGVVPVDWLDVGRPPAGAPPDSYDPADPTDLSTLVTAVAEAGSRLGTARPRSPWQPPLPTALPLSSLAPSDQDLAIVYGLEDLPSRQQQRPAVHDLRRAGHLLVAGAPKSGRSTLLRTLAGSIATSVTAEVAQLYVVDCGGGGLSSLAALPHCGAVVTPAEPERVDRLLTRLTAELSRRMQLLATAGCSDIGEYVAGGGEPLPYLAVIVDRHDAFSTALEHIDGGRLVTELQRLVRDGLAAGVRVIVTGDRSLLTGKLGGLVEDKLVLRLADRMDYTVAGLSAKTLPDIVPTGRAFRLPAGDQIQIATLSADPEGAAQNRAIRDIAATAAAPRHRPIRVDSLPPAISYAEARDLPVSGSGALVGVGGDELGQVRADGPGFLVLGTSGSGRSSALAVIARSVVDDGRPVVLVTPRRSRLSVLIPAGPGVLAVHDGGEEELAAAVATSTDTVLIIDDVEMLTETALGEQITAILRQARDTRHVVYAAASGDEAGNIYRGPLAELRKCKQGLVLAPTNPTQGDVIGTRLPRSVLSAGIPQRGALVLNGTVTAVHVPTIEPPAPARAPAKRRRAPARTESG